MADPISLSVPRSVLAGIIELSRSFTDRMHELLEKNTDGLLSTSETVELQKLVDIAEFSQLVSAAIQLQGNP